MASEPMALIVANPESGFSICDTRDGLPIAWRRKVSEAAEVAQHLNQAYPPGTITPARDTLLYEVAELCAVKEKAT